MKRNQRATYYHVWVMKDGTIVMALPGRKPSQPGGRRKPVVDEDGCHTWSEWCDHEHKWTDWANSVVKGAITNQLNLKRTLRARVEPRLDRIEGRLDALSKAIESLLGFQQPDADEDRATRNLQLSAQPASDGLAGATKPQRQPRGPRPPRQAERLDGRNRGPAEHPESP